MKFNIYPQEFPALSRYLLRFADGGRFRTSLSAVQSAARDVGELPASLRGAAFRQIAYAPARETQKYRIFAEKRIPMKQPDHRPWKVLNSEYLAHEPWFTVRREAVELPGGARIPSYYVLEYPDWVNVIACTDDGRFLLIDQYRHGLGRTSYEIVAGVRDPQDATPLDAARRELYEETGYGGGEWKEYMVLSANPATHTNLTYTFLATGVQPLSTPRSERGHPHPSVHLRRGAPAARRELHPASTDGRPSVALRRRTLRTAVTPPRRSAPPTAGKLSAGSLFFGEKAYIC